MRNNYRRKRSKRKQPRHRINYDYSFLSPADNIIERLVIDTYISNIVLFSYEVQRKRELQNIFPESEWVPVVPKKPEPKKIFVPASTTNDSPAIMPPPAGQPPLQPAQTTVFPATTEVR